MALILFEALDELDKLCEIQDDRGKSVLSLRAHFHMRAISGLYTCVNPACPDNHNQGGSVFDNITSYSGTSCNHCNGSMLELLQCKDCGEFIVSGEFVRNQQQLMVRQSADSYGVSLGLNVTDAQGNPLHQRQINGDWEKFFLSKYSNLYQCPKDNVRPVRYNFVQNPAPVGTCLTLDYNNGSYVRLSDNNTPLCAHCASTEFLPFTAPADWLNKIVGRVLLEETAEGNQQWGQYISFTDSRQGTAISAKSFNIESERYVSSGRIIRELIRQRLNYHNTETYQNAKITYNQLLPFRDNPQIQPILNQQLDIMRNDVASVELSRIANEIVDERLYRHIAGNHADMNHHFEAYRAAVMRLLLGRRTVKQHSLENNGILEVVYPAIQQMTQMPQDLANFTKEDGSEFTIEDWRDFLTIALDYVVREGNSIQPLRRHENQYIREGNHGTPIARWDDHENRENGHKFVLVGKVML